MRDPDHDPSTGSTGVAPGPADRLRKLEWLAGKLGHDITNSLASIAALSQLIRTDPALPAELRRQSELLMAEADRTRLLVQSLLDEVRQRPPDEHPAEPPAQPDRPHGRVARARILVVDDDPAIREYLARVLTQAGHEPILAADAATALEMVRADPPDGILCDQRMASMSGTAFHAALAEIDDGLARRFAFLTGDIFDDRLRAFADEHGIALLAKPSDIAGVMRVVEAILVDRGAGPEGRAQPRG